VRLIFVLVVIVGGVLIPESKLEWSCMDDFSWKLDDYSLKPMTPPPHHTFEADEIDYQDFALVITGDVFRWMVNHAALETLQRVSGI
jgi:cation-transporting ATPase 13A2